MEPKEAEQEKIHIAEKQISYVRAIVIVFGTATFFMLHNSFINYELSYTLIFLIWAYGLFVLFYRPYEKHPIFLAAWFTYMSDCIFATLWIYSTGGFYSPYHVLYYTSIVAVAFRFNLRTTMLTCGLYTLAYFVLLQIMGHLQGNETLAIVRSGFIFILGFLTNLITTETLVATRQKLLMKELMEVAQKNHDGLSEKQRELNALNTELKLQNDIFSHAEENAAIGSYSWDLEQNKLFYSDNLYRILGCETGEFEPSTEKFREFVHDDDKVIYDNIRKDLEEGREPKATVLRVVRKNGVLCHLNSTARITNSGGKKIMIGTLQDVTSDINMKLELQEKNRKLEQSNAELSSFSYVASHDLQEPVRKILTFAELILEKDRNNLKETSKGYIDRILGAARRMKSLIHAFLNYSRIDNTSIKFEKTDLNVILDDIKIALQDQIADKRALINSDHLPTINAIQFQMQQLFINLVGNALKYTLKDKQPVVTISAIKVWGKEENIKELQERTEYWKIKISDNGIGFDPQYAEKIFEVFQRLHTKEQYEGTGIGLAICKKIVQTHRGHISAKSEPGKGATFEFFLPLNLEEGVKT